MNNKLILVLVLAIPLIVLGLVFSEKKVNNNDNPNVNQVNDKQPANRPVAESNPYVQTVLDTSSDVVRYNFTGTIKELKAVEGGTQLTLTGTGTDLPPMVLTSDVRVQAIKYNPVVLTPKTINDLKAGMTVDVSMDYTVTDKRWFLRDVYIPADRNP